MKPTPAEIENGMSRSQSASDAAGQRQRHAAEDEQRVLARAEGHEQQAEDEQQRDRHDDLAAAGSRRSAARTCRPSRSSSPSGSSTSSPPALRSSATKRAEVAAAHVGGDDDAPLAVLAADLVRARARSRASATSPSGTKAWLSHPHSGASPSTLPASCRRKRDGSACSRSMSVRSASGRRTTMSKRRSPSNTCPARLAADRDRRPVLHVAARSGRSAPARRDSGVIVSTGRPVTCSSFTSRRRAPG